MNEVSDQSIVVTTPETHAMTDAYALIKILSESSRDTNISVLVNQVRTSEEGEKAFSRIADVSETFLGFRPNYLGSVPSDPQVSALLRRRTSEASFSFQTLAGCAWAKISHKLSEFTAEPNIRFQQPSLGLGLEY